MEESRVRDKINELYGYLSKLEEALPENFEDYLANDEKKAACERYFEIIIECLIDLANFFAKLKEFDVPLDRTNIFDLLFEKDIISKDICKKMKDAKGMRNILAHQYGSIDDELVFEALADEIINDSFEFIECVKKELEERI